MTQFDIRTARIAMPAATVEELQALIDGDAIRFAALLGSSVPEPLVAPPETGDVLEFFRDLLVDDPAIHPWFFRWIIDHTRNALVGSVGFAAQPDDDGYVLMGYSVYPEFEGTGYASEAANALVDWAFTDQRVTAVRATIHPSNTGSRRVAEKAGLTCLRIVETEEDGLVELWEVARAGANLRSESY